MAGHCGFFEPTMIAYTLYMGLGMDLKQGSDR